MSDRLFASDVFTAGLGEAWRLRLHRTVSALHLSVQAFVTRRELARLDERMLADIGISRAEAATEAARVPWDFGSGGGRPRQTWHEAGWRALRAAWRRHATRQRITGLDAHILKDIGVTFAEAEAEANKPFWCA